MCQLYRHFNAEGELLYVGVSLHAVARLSQHRGAVWFREIASVDVQTCPTREVAEFLEALAIRRENPRYNLVKPEFKLTPTLSYTMIREARNEAWEKAWAGEDVSDTLELCDAEEAEILPEWYRQKLQKGK